jgi:hypothetical protein
MVEVDRKSFRRFAEHWRGRVRCIRCNNPARTFPIVGKEHLLAFCSETCALVWALQSVALGHHWCRTSLAWRPGPLFCSDCAPSPAPEEGGPD